MDIQKDQKFIYLTRRQAEVVKLKETLTDEVVELTLTIGHRLKGHGETFGFPKISAIGVLMESAAKSKDLVKLKEIIHELDESIEESLRLIQNP
jgi:hypothetical protein